MSRSSTRLGALARVGLLAGLLLPLVLATGLGPASAARRTTTPAPAARAMWVWTRPAVSTLVSFASSHGVRALFVSVPADLPHATDLAWVRTLAGQASTAGIRLYALGSDTGWIDDPQAAVAWETAALSTGYFAGVHLDVEPWLHADWGTPNQPALLGRYLDLLDQVNAASTLPVELDISFWLHTLAAPDGSPLDVAVMSRVDAVTVMSYRSTATGPDSITDIGAHALATAAAAGIPARLAVETNYLGSDAASRKQTFSGMRASALTSAMAAVDAAEVGAPAYAGISVEDYNGWKVLK